MENNGGINSLTPKKGSKPPKQLIRKTFLISVLAVMLLAIFAGVFYCWRDKIASDIESKQRDNVISLEKTITALQERLTGKKTTTATDSSSSNTNSQANCTAVQPSYSTIENIQASITSGNTAALEGYMASNVNVILAATEGIGNQTPAQAVADITNYISDATSPWDFSLPASVLSSYGKGEYGQYFPNIDVVGKSANDKVISFMFDCNGKINQVFMAASESLLE
jgi:hypothetical protein